MLPPVPIIVTRMIVTISNYFCFHIFMAYVNNSIYQEIKIILISIAVRKLIVAPLSRSSHIAEK